VVVKEKRACAAKRSSGEDGGEKDSGVVKAGGILNANAEWKGDRFPLGAD